MLAYRPRRRSRAGAVGKTTWTGHDVKLGLKTNCIMDISENQGKS